MADLNLELKKLPDKPGVYIMKDKEGNIIYVGKAVVLKNRVRQYFHNTNKLPAKVKAMVSHVDSFEYIVTDSEVEALILECNLIKKYRPRYNILLKDDKGYPYIKVTMNEEYPRVFMTRRIEKDGAKYFGPYTSTGAVKETLNLIKKLFPIKTCNRVLPRDIGKKRPCLNYYIYQCLGPCTGNVNSEEYRSLMKDICMFLDGRHEEIVKRLEKDMMQASENMEFEKAAKIRDKLAALKVIAEKQKVLSLNNEDEDIVAFARDESDCCMQIFFVRNGKLIGREHFILENVADTEDKELMSSFVKQFYNDAQFIPKYVLLQHEIDDIEIVEQWLTDKRQAKVYVKVPKKGEKQRLIIMVEQNARIALNNYKDKLKNQLEPSKEGLKGLADIAGLSELPMRIEAYDISNTGLSEVVASMVVFENGMPARSEYRRFRIKSIDRQNDYASMQEVIYRRFRHAEKERLERENNPDAESRPGSDKFSRLPDLILIDGGLGHLNAVKEVLQELNVDIPVFGMVKDDSHRTRGLVSNEREIDLSKYPIVHRFVTLIQDEAHRFAVEYNKKLREKRYRKSVLDDIKGIGPKKKKSLLSHFGSIEKIKQADIGQLTEVKGISKSDAENIYSFFNE